MRLTVIVPVYNEARTLRQVIDRLRELPLELEIICVDDGSTDGTRELLQLEIEPLVARVVYQRANAGKGSAIRAAIPYATGAAVVIQDADLELDPGEFLRLLRKLESSPGCVVYGSRFRRGRGEASWAPWCANRVLTLLTNLLFGCRLTDMATAYKMFPGGVLPCLGLKCRGFEFEPEVTARLLVRRVPIVEVPIAYMPRGRKEGKKIRWHDALVYVVWLVRCRLGG